MPATPTLFVTGAAGQLGRLVIDALLETLPASAIVAGVRDPAKEAAIGLHDRGVAVRVADYARPETLADAIAGVDRLLLISGTEMGQRAAQHRNVIAAAEHAGVSLIAYTSILNADTSPLLLAGEHRETEAALANSGVPYTLLRDGWYTESYTRRIQLALQHGAFLGASGEGRISSAARADFARAAAVVLAGGDHAGRVYELAGDTAYTLAEFAAAVADASAKPLPYRHLDPDAFRKALLEAGLSEPFAKLLSNTDAGIAEGALFDDSGDLSRLIGRPTTPFRETVAKVVHH